MDHTEAATADSTPDRPRILVRSGPSDSLRTVDELREASEHGHGRQLWQQVLEIAQKATASEPLTAFTPLDGRGKEDVRQGNRDYTITHAAGQRVMACALAYTVLGEARFQEAALSQVAALFDPAAWPEWQDIYHRKKYDWDADLRTGQLSRDLGLAYDWLHSGLSPEQRSWFLNGLDERGIQPYLRAVEQRPWWLDGDNNWTTVIVGGMGVCGMALGEDHPDSGRLIDLAVPRMQNYLDQYGPEGEFNESPGYAGSSNNPVLFFSALRYFRNEPGIPAEVTRLRKHCIWLAHTLVPPGEVVPFGDCPVGRQAIRNIAFFPAVASATRDGTLQWFYLQHADSASHQAVLELLYYDATLAPESPSPPTYPLGRAFPAHDGIVSSRTSWAQDRADCVVMSKAGHGGVNHTHPDAGQVVIRGYGEPLVRDLGKVPYPFNDKRQYYHFNAHGHNVLTFDGRDLIWDTSHQADITTTTFEQPWGCAWTIDTTELYEEGETVQRSVVHVRPGVVAVLDEARFSRAGEVRVRWHPLKQAEPDENGHFVVRGDDASLTGRIVGVDAGKLSYITDHHRYEPPHDRDRMGNPMPQRHEPFIDATCHADHCRILTLFSVHRPTHPAHVWEVTDDGWSIETPSGRVTLQLCPPTTDAPIPILPVTSTQDKPIG